MYDAYIATVGQDFVALFAITTFSLVLQLHIQGDSGGICNTLGNDSMCDSKQKSPILDGYGVMTA